MDSQLNKLAERNLSLRDKIILAKSLVLSKIWYAAYLLTPNRKQCAEINNLIVKWIKGNSRMLPWYATFQKNYEEGGLGAPVIQNLLKARLVMIWKQLCTSNTTWAK